MRPLYRRPCIEKPLQEKPSVEKPPQKRPWGIRSLWIWATLQALHWPFRFDRTYRPPLHTGMMWPASTEGATQQSRQKGSSSRTTARSALPLRVDPCPPFQGSGVCCSQ
jgi:hypothetical protein